TAGNANGSHRPGGGPVLAEDTSDGVIHSFWAPSLHGKKDLIPGHVTTTAVRVERAGVYRGQCAEFCGLQHARMAFLVIAEPPDTFEAWLAGQRRAAGRPTGSGATRGEALFLGAPCILCHTVRGTPASGRL